MRYLRWSRAGMSIGSARRLASLAALAICLALVANGCSQTAEGASGDGFPTVEFPTRVPTSTPGPTSTPTPNPEPTATPEPTPTPTARDLYGPLLVEGMYDWPTQFQDDLVDVEVFAINVFVSTQNAVFAAVAAQSDLEEFEPVLPFVDVILLDSTSATIATERQNETAGRTPLPATELVSVEVVERTAEKIVLRSCEHIDIEVTESDGSTFRERGTGEVLNEFERIGDNAVRYVGWTVDRGVQGDLVKCVG